MPFGYCSIKRKNPFNKIHCSSRFFIRFKKMLYIKMLKFNTHIKFIIIIIFFDFDNNVFYFEIRNF